MEMNGLTINIIQDDDPESPREWDNFGTMVCWHKRYDLGDKHNYKTPQDFYEAVGVDVVDLPLYLYDHSGITMATSPFPCPWDSGQVGHIYVTYEKIQKEFGEVTHETMEKARELLKAEVEAYDQYLTGEVYGFEIFGSDGELLDSCWGYYEYEYAVESAQGAARCLRV